MAIIKYFTGPATGLAEWLQCDFKAHFGTHFRQQALFFRKSRQKSSNFTLTSAKNLLLGGEVGKNPHI